MIIMKKGKKQENKNSILLKKGTFKILNNKAQLDNPQEIEDLKILVRFAREQPLLEDMDLDKINMYIYKNFLMILDLLATDEMLDLFLEKLSEEQREILYSKEAVSWHNLLP
jgi:hypothetical protein